MRLLGMVLAVLLLTTSAYGAAIDFCVKGNVLSTTSGGLPGNYVTSNTVSYSSVAYTATFINPAKKILLINEGSGAGTEVFISFGETTGYKQANAGGGASTSGHTFKLLSGASLSTECYMTNMTFVSTGGTGNLQWIATSDVGQP